MKLTAISSPKIPMKIAKGIKVTAKTNRLEVNNLYKNDERILTRVCPAVRLANNRKPSETDLAKYETNSITTNKGTNARGVPAGTKKEKNLSWCLTKARIVTPKKIVTDNPKQRMIELVIAKLQATLLTKFEIKTKTNNE